MANDKSSFQLVTNGILAENPIFKLALSMCPAVGISTTVMNGFMLGVAVLFVQVFSSVTISLFKNVIHPRIRIPTYTLTIATWVTVIDLVLAAFLPEAYAKMGIFVKIIVAFAIITMRLEMFASKESVNSSFWDGLGMGLGFTLTLSVLAGIRELLATGGISLLKYTTAAGEIEQLTLGEWYIPWSGMAMPVGAFVTLGLLLGVVNLINKKAKS